MTYQYITISASTLNNTSLAPSQKLHTHNVSLADGMENHMVYKTNVLVVGKTYLIYDQTTRYEKH
jgi:hypothetical protein